MATLFFKLYPLASIAFIIGYIPQILKLLNATTPPANVSISSWLIWLKGNVITLGYTHFYIEDVMMVATTGLCLFMALAVLGLTIYNKHYRFNSANSLCANRR